MSCPMSEVSKKVPRGIRNNNPLNIRKGSTWKGERPNQSDPAFEEFTSMEYGIRAAFKLMRNHITGFSGTRKKMNTIRKLISVWAPPSENATAHYADLVAASVERSPYDLIDPNDRKLMCAIARAMAWVETGVWLDEQIFESAWDLL